MTGSDQAFGQLVSRHFDLVYSAALRMGRGDSHLAQDVAQLVFTDLARKARGLAEDTVLGGWLYRHTCFTAAKAIRTERRRQAREQQAVEMNAPSDANDAVWRRLSPLLDEAMGRLGASDRNAIVLRFFERQSFRVVGGALGTSEDAARKRVDRALEKLRNSFGRQGVIVSAAALAETLSSQAVTMAPAGMASAVAAASITGAVGGGGIIPPLTKLLFVMTKLKIAAGVVAAGMATVLIIESQTSGKLREENRGLRQEIGRLDQLRAENERQALAKASAPPPQANDQLRELLRLRGEVGGLKRQLAEAALGRQKVVRPPEAQAEPDAEAEQRKEAAIAKLNYTKSWMLAFHLFAGDNNGQFPTNFDQAMTYLPEEAKALTNLTTGQFEIVYQGSPTSITNPGDVIVLREQEAAQTPDGGWIRAYGFADGHSEIHKAPNDGNFDPWESQRLLRPAAQ